MARKLGKVIGLKVEHHDPITVEILAVQLAEAMQGEIHAERDADAYRTQARAEQTKARNLTHVISQLKLRAKDPPPRTRRMDPLAEYDLGKCEEELSSLRDRAKELLSMADSFAKKAVEHRTKAQQLRVKISEKNAAASQK